MGGNCNYRALMVSNPCLYCAPGTFDEQLFALRVDRDDDECLRLALQPGAQALGRSFLGAPQADHALRAGSTIEPFEPGALFWCKGLCHQFRPAHAGQILEIDTDRLARCRHRRQAQLSVVGQRHLRRIDQTAAPVAIDSSAELLLRDNVRNRSRIERAYRQAIAHAKHEVVIANAYFVPGAKLRRSLIHAARRGVRVQLLLQGRYEYFMQFHAAKPFYNSLLEAGVEIHEYQAGFLHAKVAVIDGKWATVGSSNLDPLSLLLAREANVVVDDAVFAQVLLAHLRFAMDHHSQPLEKRAFENRPLLQRAKDLLGFWVMRLTLFLTGTDY